MRLLALQGFSPNEDNTNSLFDLLINHQEVTMWIPMPQGTFKSSDERTVTARAPEALEL